MAAGVQDYTYKADSGIAAPVLAALPAVAAEGVPAPCARVDAARVAPAHSPTDVFLKNAALLI